MNNYYLLSWTQHKQVASALAPKGTKLDHELIADIEGVKDLPFELELVKLTVDKTGIAQSNDLSGLDTIWLDYQPNSLAWPLMSEKMKTIVANNLTGKEGINWIAAKVDGIGECRTYYIPRFENMLNVLDEQKTMYVKGTDRIIKPCFSLAKISSFSIFHKPSAYDLWKITSGLYVSEELKKAIQKEKLTGIDFEKTTVS
jgi:hypothetical protein